MKYPKVSVVLSIYNVDKYIHHCMDTILNQTLRDIEIIMVDDESPDNCPRICDQYAQIDSRVKVIHKENAGLGMARNTGIDIANGEFICFPDPDDYFELDMLESLYNTAKERKLQAVYTGFTRVTHDERIISKNPEVKEYTEISGHLECLDHRLAMVSVNSKGQKYSMSCAKVLFDLQFLRKFQLRFVSEREFISEDMIFDINFYRVADRVGYLPNCHYYYRLNPKSLSKGIIKNHYIRCKKQYNEILRLFNLDGPIPKESLYAANLYLLDRVLNIMKVLLMKNEEDCIVQAQLYELRNDNLLKIINKDLCKARLPFISRVLFSSVIKGPFWIFKLYVNILKKKSR